MKLYFVIPWYGEEIPGGAEAECRGTAKHLRSRGVDVEVLTTCIREFQSDWARNHHRPGLSEVGGIPVRRFPVRRCNKRAFDEVNARLMAGLPISRQEEQVFLDHMVLCPDLERFIADHRADAYFSFIPYMFATTVNGAKAAGNHAIQVPCLHDEAYARLSIYRGMFRKARGIVFQTREELALARDLYGIDDASTAVIGAGIELPEPGNGAGFQGRHGLGDYLLFAGRKSTGKNTPLLVDHFCRYVSETGAELSLVLIGSGNVQIPAGFSDRILDLGFVTAKDKQDALEGAIALAMPSVNESFSIVLMEAWAQGSPVLVHGACDVTVGHCKASNGGLWFRNYAEFRETLNYLVEHPEEAARMGANGRRYVQQNYAWDRVTDRWLHHLTRWGFSK